MGPGRFTTSFDPAEFGVVSIIEQMLLPSVSCEEENGLGFRKLGVELYKLNVRNRVFPLYSINHSVI